jgi:hypothetical protein
VLAAAFGQIRMRDVRWKWNEAVARNPTAEPLLGARAPGRVITDGTPVARTRFEVGNAKAEVSVDSQPPAEILLNSDSWSLRMTDLWGCFAVTIRTLDALAPLFSREQRFWPT